MAPCGSPVRRGQISTVFAKKIEEVFFKRVGIKGVRCSALPLLQMLYLQNPTKTKS
jgi:hypothetical protein